MRAAVARSDAADRSRRRSPGIFAAIGRFSVRHRWAVVIGWLVATAAAVAFLPSLGSVIRNDNVAFLPASSPSVQAARLAAPLLANGQQSGTIVAIQRRGPLTPADQAAFDRVVTRARRVPLVSAVRDAAVSASGLARTAVVSFAPATAGGGHAGADAVAGVRRSFDQGLPGGLVVHLTGPLPELVDQQAAGSRTAGHVQLLTGIFIVVLLLLAFRSTLAPFVTLAPAGLALALAGPLIAESTALGVEISSLLQLLLTALVLGAGTDYGLFLIFRYREYLRAGLAPTEAIVAAVTKVGESITFSAATVVAALLSLLLASFGLYRGVGPGLAIGIVIVLLIELTFFPALLALLGRAVFWPSVPRVGQPSAGRWGRVAGRVSRRPAAALVVGVLVLSGLALCLVDYAPSGFNPGGAIAGSDSAAGLQALELYFGAAAVAGTDVVFRLPTSAWRDPAVLGRAAASLAASGEFSSVTGPLQPDGVDLPAGALSYAHRRLGPPQSLPAVAPRDSPIPSFFYDTYRATAQFVSADGRTVLYRVSLRAGSPGTTAALQAVPAVRSAVEAVGRQIGASRSGVAGQAAGAADVSAVSGADIVKIAPVVLVVLALLLALVLRSLVAPLYLVLSVGLSYLASLGLAVLVFVVIGGQLGINFTLPFFMFVFIMALGEDYNILVMSRIREEAAVLPLRRAVAAALGTTGTTVTSAGLVLAGTFSVFAVVGGRGSGGSQIRDVGVGLALGVLMDTFIVRTVLVPCTVVLLGRWNWWPSKLSRTGPQPLGESAELDAQPVADEQPAADPGPRAPAREP